MDREQRYSHEIDALNEVMVKLGHNGDHTKRLAFIDGANWQRGYCFDNLHKPADREPVTGRADLDKLANDYSQREVKIYSGDDRMPIDLCLDAFRAGFNEGLLSQADAHPMPTDWQGEASIAQMLGGLDDKASEILALIKPSAKKVQHHNEMLEVARGIGQAYNEAAAATYEGRRIASVDAKALEDLEAQYQQAKADPNADDDYLRGYNNGVILAHATIFGHEPDFIAASGNGKFYSVGVDDKLYQVPQPVAALVADLRETVANQEKLTAELRLEAKDKDHWRDLARNRGQEINALQNKLDELRALIDR